MVSFVPEVVYTAEFMLIYKRTQSDKKKQVSRAPSLITIKLRCIEIIALQFVGGLINVLEDKRWR